MKVAIVLSVLLFLFVNLYLFVIYFKEKKIVDPMERLAVLFGVNMSVLFADSLMLFFGALIEKGLF